MVRAAGKVVAADNLGVDLLQIQVMLVGVVVRTKSFRTFHCCLLIC